MRLYCVSAIFLLTLCELQAPGADSKVCNGTAETKCRKPGLFLPIWEPQDYISTGDRVGRAFVYFIALMYVFLGVSIISDRFMSAIEVITSSERPVVVTRPDGLTSVIRVRVWNETVSNLTLMALGSSAPEILLSVIEICGNSFDAGELGPSTIVGSAAFNLFVITGICIFVVPSTEVRRIYHINVFWVTVFASTFAYIWLYLMLSVITYGRVDWWEGLLTLFFFIITVVGGYIADKRLLFGRFEGTRYGGSKPMARGGSKVKHYADTNDVEFIHPDRTSSSEFEQHRQDYIKIFRKLREQNPEADIPSLTQKAERELIQRGPKSRAFYRIQATRKLIGSGDILNHIPDISKQPVPLDTLDGKEAEQSMYGGSVEPTIEICFDPSHYTCLENVGTIYVNVVCRRINVIEAGLVSVDYKTKDGTANAVSDYTPVQGTLTFRPNESAKTIGIPIVDNEIYEEDEHFFVLLSNPTLKPMPGKREGSTKKGASSPRVRCATPSTATIMIIDNDHAGCFEFKDEQTDVSEAAGELKLTVLRTRGSRGRVKIPFKTKEGTAKNIYDFVTTEDEILFSDDQIEALIRIPIVNDDQYEKNKHFFVEIADPIWLDNPTKTKAMTAEERKAAEAGAPVLGAHKTCKVVIKESMEFKSFVDKAMAATNTALIVGTSTWKQQLKDAITVEGEEEDGKVPGYGNYIMHFFTLPWKLLFVLVPPTNYFGGWLCFVSCIIVIGIVTALIGDLASAFGCTVGLQDSVTAISIVALGTSLPDTFASKTAAINDDHADACIVNVTGSNAVNVFLGLGIAWFIAAVYHNSKGDPFLVEPGSLAFSVTLFCIGSVLCFGLLQFRRYNKNVGGELGGLNWFKIFSIIFCVGIWLSYLILSSLEAYCVIPGF